MKITAHLAWIAPFLAGYSYAHAEPASLCSAGDTVLFTCQAGRKTVSVCGSRDLSSSSGFLQYRFGNSPRAVELEYPKERGHPKDYFRFKDEGQGAKGSLSNLQFTIGAYTYTVYRFRHATESEFAGVAVKRGSSPLSFLRCGGAEPTDWLQELYKVGLPEVPDREFIEGPP